jgi:hypothetical protein
MIEIIPAKKVLELSRIFTWNEKSPLRPMFCKEVRQGMGSEERGKNVHGLSR